MRFEEDFRSPAQGEDLIEVEPRPLDGYHSYARMQHIQLVISDLVPILPLAWVTVDTDFEKRDNIVQHAERE